MCKLICQLDGIIVVFITLAKVTDSLRTAFKKKKKAFDILNKEDGCSCMYLHNCHPYSTEDDNNNLNMHKSLA